MSNSISSLTPEEDNVCLLQQYEEHLTDMKWELAAVRHELLLAEYEDMPEKLMNHWTL